MISGRNCAIQNTVSHYSPVIIAPFVDKFIAPASRKKFRSRRRDVFPVYIAAPFFKAVLT
jgi:hypothetical protein